MIRILKVKRKKQAALYIDGVRQQGDLFEGEK